MNDEIKDPYLVPKKRVDNLARTTRVDPSVPESATERLLPELKQHWRNLQQEFQQAGVPYVLRSGYRTAAQQNALHRAGYPTKGNDGYTKISPHQEGRALDIGFTSNKERGRQIIADYARRNSLYVPTDEPWHITLPRQRVTQQEQDPYLVSKPSAPSKSTQPAGDDPYLVARPSGQTLPPTSANQSATSPAPAPSVPSITDALDQLTANTNRATQRLQKRSQDQRQHQQPPITDALDQLTASTNRATQRLQGQAARPRLAPQAEALKTPQVTSRVTSEGEDIPLQPVKPVQFEAGALPASEARLTGIPELERQKLLESPPQSQLLSKEYTANLGNEGGNQYSLSKAALRSLGLDEGLDQIYQQATGRPLLTIDNAQPDRAGNFRFTMPKRTTDFLNAFAQGLHDGGIDEGLRRAALVNQVAREDVVQSKTKAQAGAVQSVAEAEAATKRGVESPFLRGVTSGASRAAQAIGTVLPESMGDFERKAKVLRAASEEAEQRAPLTDTASQVKAGVGEAIPTAMMFAVTGPLKAAQLPVLGALEGFTPEERVQGALQGAATAGTFALPGALAPNITGLSQKALAGGTIAAIPATEAAIRGESVPRAVAGSLPYAVLPFLHGSAKPEEQIRVTPEGRTNEVQNTTQPPVAAQRPAVEPGTATPAVGTRGMAVQEPSPLVAPEPKAADTGLSTESTQRFYHKDFGEVEVAPSQSKAGKGRVKVIDSDGNPHYVRRADLSGRGNQRMVPLKPGPEDAGEALSQPGQMEQMIQKVFPEARVIREKIKLTEKERQSTGIKEEEIEGYKLRLPNGIVRVLTDRNLSPRWLRWAYETRGIYSPRHRIIELQSLDPATLSHEKFHFLFDTLYTPEEKVSVINHYGSEEKAAEAYRRRSGHPVDSLEIRLFDKIHQFIDRVRSLKDLIPSDELIRQRMKDEAAYSKQLLRDTADPSYIREIEQRLERWRMLRKTQPGDEPQIVPGESSGVTRPIVPLTKPSESVPRVPPATPEATMPVASPARGGDDSASRIDAEPQSPTPERFVTKPVTDEPTTAAKQESMATDRVALDLPELPPAERKSWQESLDKAKPENANRLATEVLAQPRGLNEDESASLVVRAQQVKSEHRQLLEEIGKATDPETIAEKRAQLGGLEQEFDTLSRATKQSGTQNARALAAQKLTINQDYDLVSLVQRAKAAKGRELTPEERTRYEQQAQRITELESQLEQERARAVEQSLDKQIQRLSKRRRISETKQSLDDEFAQLKTQFAQARAEARNVQPSGLAGLDPEGKLTKLIAQMARNRVRAGVNDAARLVDEVYNAVREHLPEVSKRDIRDAISGYSLIPKTTRTELQRQIDSLRSELQSLSKTEDVEAGIRSPRREGPKESEARRLPMEGPRKSEARQSGVPVQGPKLSDVRKLPMAGPKISDAPFVGPRLSDIRKVPEQGPQMVEHGPSKKFVTRNTVRQKQLESQITDLERRLREGDFEEPTKPPKLPYSREVQQAEARVQRLKDQFDAELERVKKAQRSPAEKALDLLVRWKRFAVLTYPTTLGKLTTAATGRMVQTPIEEAIGGALSKVPGIGKIAAKAPREGGLNPTAEAKAVSQLWQSDSFRGILEHLKTGRDMLDVLYGDRKADEGGALEFPGRVHGALKEIPKRAEFFRAYEKRLAHAARNGADIADPQTQLGVSMEAYADARRAIFMQPNIVSKAFNELMGTLSRHGASGKTLAALSRIEFPITRVPVNYVAEQTSLLPPIGIAKGIVRIALSKGVGNLKPAEADYVLRAWKKAGVGMGMTALGYFNPNLFGGYYQQGEKRSTDEAGFGEVKLGSVHIPKWATHIPLIEAAQFGATVRRVEDKLRHKDADHPLASGIGSASWELTKEIPFINQPERLLRAMESGDKLKAGGILLGQEARGMIPGFMQQAAKTLDRTPSGENRTRRSQGFTDEVKQGIPWARQTVTLNPVFGSKASPATDEIQRLGITMRGATKKPDESTAAFTARLAAQNAELKHQLEELIASPHYQSMSDVEKRKVIHTITTRVGSAYSGYSGERQKSIRELLSAP